MKLLVGLGNPGPRYETTRHNIGFLAIDLLVDEFANASWETAARFHGLVASGTMWGERCSFLKPSTFMNKSGQAVGALARYFKIPSHDIIVLHDDIDVPAGQVRARVGGGHGGNNGVRSIQTDTGMKDFHRIKIGVGRPGPESQMEVSSWVLAPLSDQELLDLQKETIDAVKIRLKGIFERS